MFYFFLNLFQRRLRLGQVAAAGVFEDGHGFLDVLQSVGVVFLQPCLERSRKTDFAHQMERDARLNLAAIFQLR